MGSHAQNASLRATADAYVPEQLRSVWLKKPKKVLEFDMPRGIDKEALRRALFPFVENENSSQQKGKDNLKPLWNEIVVAVNKEENRHLVKKLMEPTTQDPMEIEMRKERLSQIETYGGFTLHSRKLHEMDDSASFKFSGLKDTKPLIAEGDTVLVRFYDNPTVLFWCYVRETVGTKSTIYITWKQQKSFGEKKVQHQNHSESYSI